MTQKPEKTTATYFGEDHQQGPAVDQDRQWTVN
jgi:hypothetical protein